MSASPSARDRGGLQARVDASEKRLVEHRRAVRALATGIEQKVRDDLVSPGMIIASIALGVVVERHTHREGWSVAMFMNLYSALMMLTLPWRQRASARAAPVIAEPPRPEQSGI